MKKLQIALVGVGGMARLYRHRYQEAEGAELALVIDANPEFAKAASDALGGIRWSTHFEDCLADDIDMVDISTPNFLHAEQAVRAIEAGKHVTVQKPLAPTVEEAQKIVAAAKKTDKNVGVYMSLFNHAITHDLKKLVDGGYLGQIEGAHCRNAHRGGLHTEPGTWRGDLKKCGGGSLIQLAIHNIDLVQWLLGSPITEVSAYSHNLHCPNIGGDDATAVCCKFANGTLGTIESSYCADQSEMSLYGTKGHFCMIDDYQVLLCLDEEFDGDVIHYHQPHQLISIAIGDSISEFEQDNPHDQSIAFVKAVLQHKPAPVSIETGLRDLKVVKAVYESAKRKEFVTID